MIHQCKVTVLDKKLFPDLQEAWLAAWSAGGDSAVVRFFVSLVLAAFAGAALFPILPAVERFAGLRREEAP